MQSKLSAIALTTLLASLLLAGCTTKSGYRVGPAINVPSSGQIPVK